MIIAYLTLLSGAYLAGGAFLMTTHNWRSALVFKAIPALIGFGMIIAGANMAGWLP